MIGAIVCGAAGKMGRRICALLEEDSDLQLVGAVESVNSETVGQDIGLIVGKQEKGLKIEDDLGDIISKGDVIIEFTTTDATLSHLEIAKNSKTPMVIGTTGFNNQQLSQIEKFSKVAPVVLAPNMSLGVNLLFKLVEEVAGKLGEEYDVEIVEMHHRFKADAPSGTALKLAEFVAKGLSEKLDDVAVFGRRGLIGARSRKEIGIMSLRGGDVVGEHTVIFAGLGERIELTHKASSRDTFARGALRAAKWVVGKTPGLYSMHDVLGLN